MHPNSITNLHAVAHGGMSSLAIGLMLLFAFMLGGMIVFLLLRRDLRGRAGVLALLLAIGSVTTMAQGGTPHSVTLTWNYTQGATPAASFVITRGAASGGPYPLTVINGTLAALCTPVAGSAVNFTCVGTDTQVLPGGTVSFYVGVAVDGTGDQSAISAEASATWKGNPNPLSGLKAVSN